jgi:signal recognition particle subunit SRP54
MLAAADLQRPAAVEQLRVLGDQVGVPVYADDTKIAPHGQVAKGAAVAVCRAAVQQAKQNGRDILILDTAGRLAIDEELMNELKEVNAQIGPHQVFLVLDAMTGQDAVNVAQEFAERVEFDGVLMTKLDGDARGGAALSVKAITGKPILYASTGEKLDAFERFHPDRMAQRILGMGDVMSLIEKVEKQTDEDKAKELERKMRENRFTLDDFLEQLQQIRKMGPLTGLLKMIPGMGQQLSGLNVDERELDRVQAIITSMTPYERAHPEVLNGSRRRRIAHGSGTTIQAVNQLVKQFGQMQKVMKQMSSGKMPNLQQLMAKR